MPDRAKEIYEAAAKGDTAEVDALVKEHGINVESAYYGNIALHVAAINNNLEVIKLLLKKEADVTVTDIMEQTPLHKAAREGNLEITKWLLGFGSDAQAKDKHNETAKDKAKKLGYHELASFLGKFESMKVSIAKNSIAFYSCTNDAENLQASLANQSAKKASDIFFSIHLQLLLLIMLLLAKILLLQF